MPSDGAEEQEAVLTDVVHNEANLIHMRGQHDFHWGRRMDHSSHIAMLVGGDVVSMVFNVASVELRNGLLKAAGRGGIDK
jgi:hypothetical protein